MRVPTRALASLLVASGSAAMLACADGAGPSTPTPPSTATSVVASVEYVGNRAALLLDNGVAARARVNFTGATDPIPNNSPFVPPFADANLLALGPLSWNATGTKLAMVATLAFDQSEVVVTDANGGSPRVASVNTQIILSRPDWSPDGTRLAYAMSTLQQARGVDLFVTDLAANAIQRLTTGLNYSQVGGAVRFSSDGRSVFYSRPAGESGAPFFDKICEVWRIDLATGQQVRLAQGIAGAVQAIARSGTWALVIRIIGVLPSGDHDRRLVRVPLAGTSPEVVLIPNGRLQYAHLTSDDLHALFARDESTTPGNVSNVYRTIPASGGNEVAVRGTGAQTIVTDVFFKP